MERFTRSPDAGRQMHVDNLGSLVIKVPFGFPAIAAQLKRSAGRAYVTFDEVPIRLYVTNAVPRGS